MTTEEASNLKTESENAIVDILNKLEKETSCKVDSIHFTRTTTECYATGGELEIGRSVDIILNIP
jgi:hypothetical protein